VRKPFKEQTIFETLSQHLGVKYIYEESESWEGSSQAEPLTSEQLSVMPKSWLLKLSNAVLEADSEAILTLIQDIPDSQESVAKRLTLLVRQFQFEQILDLIESIPQSLKD
jgi:hypothetical protein